MSGTLKVTVPITLRKGADGFLIEVTAKSGKSAALALTSLKAPIVSEAFNEWAMEQLIAVYTSKRRMSGLKDSGGKDIAEGDIVEKNDVRYVVKWSAEDAAFVITNEFSQTQNLREIAQYTYVGDIFITPELLQAAKPIA
jgi:YopX protein